MASNKFQAGTEKLIRLFFPGVEFAAVFGQREGVPLKPDPAVVGEILALTGVAKERVLYVGDSGVDMQTAPSSLAAISIPIFVAVLVANGWVHDWALIQKLAERELIKTPLDTGGDSPPSAAVQVARCMVILV